MKAPAAHLVLFVLAAAMVCSCMPSHSRLQPYRSDAAAAVSLAQHAGDICACLQRPLPPHAFTTDGCSFSPDGNWASCCVEHDIAYWCGGSADDRRAVDRRLERCVVAKGHTELLAEVVYLSVRGGGVPWKPFSWRWAYGWDGLRGYEERASAGESGCFADAQ